MIDKYPFNNSIYVDTLIGLTSNSTCLRRRTAALVLNDHGSIIGMGSNGAPDGVDACTDTGICLRMNMPRGHSLDQCVAVHAEMNAISDAQNKGLSVSGCSIICTDSPCLDCLKLIITSGITYVKYLRSYPIAGSSAYEAIIKKIKMEQMDLNEHIKSRSFDLNLK